jgi:pimeloyl-ACP methyl ester carboxylesterase
VKIVSGYENVPASFDGESVMAMQPERSQSRSTPIFFVAAGMLLGIATWTFLRSQRDKRSVLAKLRSGSQMLTTRLGQVEYTTVGYGQPILVIHGAGGGYDQGLLLSQFMNTDYYRFISISRPGYRRTPLGAGKTFAQQADLYAAVMDSLDIDRAIVIAISAGGMPALQFAQRHPRRCQALILLSAVGPVTQTIHAPAWIFPLARAILSADWLIWLLKQINLLPLMATLGAATPELYEDANKMKLFNDILDGFFPSSDWRDGMVNDVEQLAHTGIVLEQIKSPTLLIHGTEDRHLPYAAAQLHAERMPHADLILFQNATHFAVATHRDEVASAIGDFIRWVI